MSAPAFFSFHDPQGDELWTFRFLLGSGLSIVSAVVDVVDVLGVVDATTDLLISDVQSGSIDGDLWGVTFRVRNGSALAPTVLEPSGPAKTYILRCRVTDNATP